MNEDFAIEVQEAATKVVQDYEKRIRREKIKTVIKCNAILVFTTIAVVHALNKYNEKLDEN